jgi:hypothetical protein
VFDVKASTFKLLLAIFAVAFSQFAAAQDSSPAALVSGLPLKSFIAAFNKAAQGAGDPTIGPKACEQRPIPNSTLRSWACRFTYPAFLSGLVEADGKLVDVSLTARPSSVEEFHLFRRASRYLVRTAQGGLATGDGILVTDLLTAASKKPGVMAKQTLNDLRFLAMKEQDDRWFFAVERSKSR